MSVFIISDLHIRDADDAVYQSFLALIQKRTSRGDTVVLAGDIFDLFVGKKSIFQERYAEFFNALREATLRGVQFHYIEGNHDFLLKKAFPQISGISVHPHEVRFDIGDKRFLVLHGDTVDRLDYGYRFLRAFFRSPLMKFLLFILPGKWIDWIGNASSRYSRSSKATLFTEIPIERRERLRSVYRSFAAEKIAQGYDFVAMGHCHDLDEMSFVVGERAGHYMNVGFPRAHGSILRWNAGDQKFGREPLEVEQA